jgi:hypothetical protein
MVIFGLGIGAGYLPSIRNSWRYFPEKRGLISGIILGALGMSALIFTSIADAVVNPDNIDSDSDGFFPSEIASRMETLLLILIIVYSIQGTIAVCLIFPYQEQLIINNETVINNHAKDNEETNEETLKERIIGEENVIPYYM